MTPTEVHQENGTTPVDTRAQGFVRLREPIEASMVGKLPKPTKKENKKGKCKPAAEGGEAPGWQDHFCGGWHGLPAVHLDYVGHAAVTSRLLEVDPEWDWEPKAGWDENGEPRFVRVNGKPVRLWINLTVLGVTRPGVGTVDAGVFDAEKQLIGDALRNAAMRFGVALDLWIKGSDEEVPTTVEAAPESDPERWYKAAGWEDRAAHDAFRAVTIEHRNALHPDDRDAFVRWCQENDYGMNRGNPRPEAEELRRHIEMLRDTRDGLDGLPDDVTADLAADIAASAQLSAEPESHDTNPEDVAYVALQQRHQALMPKRRKRADKVAEDALLCPVTAAVDPDEQEAWAKLLDGVEAEAAAEHPPFPESS